MKKIILIAIISLIILVLIVGIDINSKQDFEELEQLDNIIETENTIEEDTLIVEEYVASNGKIYEYIAILKIPSLEIEYPVLSDASKELMKISLNKYWGQNPNKQGNFCIIGHNYNDSRFFGKLNKIQIGDFSS